MYPARANAQIEVTQRLMVILTRVFCCYCYGPCFVGLRLGDYTVSFFMRCPSPIRLRKIVMSIPWAFWPFFFFVQTPFIFGDLSVWVALLFLSHVVSPLSILATLKLHTIVSRLPFPWFSSRKAWWSSASTSITTRRGAAAQSAGWWRAWTSRWPAGTPASASRRLARSSSTGSRWRSPAHSASTTTYVHILLTYFQGTVGVVLGELLTWAVSQCTSIFSLLTFRELWVWCW